MIPRMRRVVCLQSWLLKPSTIRTRILPEEPEAAAKASPSHPSTRRAAPRRRDGRYGLEGAASGFIGLGPEHRRGKLGIGCVPAGGIGPAHCRVAIGGGAATFPRSLPNPSHEIHLGTPPDRPCLDRGLGPLPRRVRPRGRRRRPGRIRDDLRPLPQRGRQRVRGLGDPELHRSPLAGRAHGRRARAGDRQREERPDAPVRFRPLPGPDLDARSGSRRRFAPFPAKGPSRPAPPAPPAVAIEPKLAPPGYGAEPSSSARSGCTPSTTTTPGQAPISARRS